MTVGLKFESVAGTKATELDQVKIITLTDGSDNTYTLDITGGKLELKYHKGSDRDATNDKKFTVVGLATALESLLTADSSTDGKSVLEKEVEKTPIVSAITSTLDNNKVTAILDKLTNKVVQTSQLETPDVAKKILGATDASGKKSILVEELGKALDRVTNDDNDKVYGQTGHEKIAKDFLADKYPLAKIDATNLTDANNKKAFAKAILPALDDKKSILVEELGKALDRVANDDNDKVYGQTGHEKIAKDFLADKGLKPTPEELAGHSGFMKKVNINVSAEDPGFQGAVREVMLQPFYKIPEGENEPMCCYDPHPTCLLGA